MEYGNPSEINVKPVEYLLGVGSYLWLLCMVALEFLFIKSRVISFLFSYLEEKSENKKMADALERVKKSS